VIDLVHAALLGVVQGLTEFLPVSSSAHLILARELFGWDGEAFGLPFDIATHVGTLGAVLLYFRHDIREMARAMPQGGLGQGRGDRRLRLIAIGTIPVVVVGGLAAGWLTDTVRTPQVAAVTLALGGIVFLIIERLGPRLRSTDEGMRAVDALLIGLAQTLALIPGVSRSGATISAGMALGFNREVSARFGFLLGIPAILGAAAKAVLVVVREGEPIDIPLFAVGIAVSFVVGYVTVAAFMQFLGRYSLDVFAFYRLGLAAVVVAWSVW
jgi:undecaprenyl-diphosphatase